MELIGAIPSGRYSVSGGIAPIIIEIISGIHVDNISFINRNEHGREYTGLV